MKRLISLILVTVSLLALISCSSDIKMPKADNNTTVLIIDGNKINYDVFRYFFLNAKDSIDGGDESYWENDPEAEEKLKNEVLDMLLSTVATSKLASKYKQGLTKSQKKVINEQLKEWKNGAALNVDDSHMTSYSFVYLQRYVAVWSNIYNYVISEESGIVRCDDKTVLSDVPKNFKNIRYLMLEFDDSNKEEKKALAEDLLERARNGGDFERFVKDYCEDNYMKNIAGVGYYFTNGQIASEIEEITNGLEIGSFSDVIELDGVFFVIHRIEIDMDYVESHLNQFIEMYLARCYDEMINEIKASLKVELTDIWENASVSNVK